MSTGKLVSSIHVELQEGEDLYNAVDAGAQEMLIDMGIYPEEIPRPDSQFVDENGIPRVPNDPSGYTNPELGELLTILNNYRSYIADQCIKIEGLVDIAAENVKLVKNRALLSKTGGTEKERTALQALDRRFVMANTEHMKLKSVLKKLKAKEKSMEGSFKTVSRIISLRDQELRAGEREGRVQNSKARRHVFQPVAGEFEEPPYRVHEVPQTRPAKTLPTRSRSPRRRKVPRYEG